MTEASNRTSFEKIVEWAYCTLPEKIRNLPDFPGIQITDEPPEEMSRRMSKRRNWPRGAELLGCYSGVSRIKRQHNLVQTAPDLIFVFREQRHRCPENWLDEGRRRVRRDVNLRIERGHRGELHHQRDLLADEEGCGAGDDLHRRQRVVQASSDRTTGKGNLVPQRELPQCFSYCSMMK